MASQSPPLTVRRSSARLAAVQALYQIAVVGTDAETVLGEFVRFRLDTELDGDRFVSPDKPLFARIVRGAVSRRNDIDPLVEGALDPPWTNDIDPLVEGALDPPWTVARLEVLLRAVLQAGCWELLENADTSPAIIITDYVDVAHAFFGGREPAMVNAVLDRVARQLRTEELAPAPGS